MKVAIHQPQYLSWPGYFNKIYQSDVFVFLDDVQYKKNDWINRNRIRTSSGWQWITVPVEFKFKDLINEVRINNRVCWRRKHLQALKINYSRAPFFKDYISFFEGVFSREWIYLSEFCIFLVEQICNILNIKKKFVLSSSLNIHTTGTQRLIDICRKLGADTYISGQGAKNYLQKELFMEYNINLKFQEYKIPCYRQAYKGWVENLSIVDVLFCCGDDSLKIVKGDG